MADFAEYPHMIFVDGENFTIRGQDFAKKSKLPLVRGEWWEPDTFLWIPDIHGEYPLFSDSAWIAQAHRSADIRAQRSYYYTAVIGDERRLRKARLAIRSLGFEPNVFKKAKGTQSKGVDVTLTSDFVSHAYRNSYEVAYLVAGDGDYVPMVNEAKRAGKRVVVAFFENHGLNDELRIAADHFIDLSKSFRDHWNAEHRRLDRENAKGTE
jgi:uncharacterized LabA/DUF88 family protein